MGEDLPKRKDLINLLTQFTLFHCATAAPLSTNTSLVVIHAVRDIEHNRFTISNDENDFNYRFKELNGSCNKAFLIRSLSGSTFSSRSHVDVIGDAVAVLNYGTDVNVHTTGNNSHVNLIGGKHVSVHNSVKHSTLKVHADSNVTVFDAGYKSLARGYQRSVESIENKSATVNLEKAGQS